MSQFGKTPGVMQLLVFLALVALSPFAEANILGNGDSGPPDLLTPTGTTLASTSGTIVTPTFKALFTASVISDPANTFCAGCLDFVYRFTNLGPDVLERFSGYNFLNFMTDVGYDPTTSGPAPDLVDRSVGGKVVGFDFSGSDGINRGKRTPVLVIETNATKFTNGFLSAQDGTAGFAVAFGPATVPEPSSLAMVGGGLLAIGTLVRKFVLGR